MKTLLFIAGILTAGSAFAQNNVPVESIHDNKPPSIFEHTGQDKQISLAEAQKSGLLMRSSEGSQTGSSACYVGNPCQGVLLINGGYPAEKASFPVRGQTVSASDKEASLFTGNPAHGVLYMHNGAQNPPLHSLAKQESPAASDTDFKGSAFYIGRPGHGILHIRS